MKVKLRERTVQEEMYMLTPKGIALGAMYDAGLINTMDNPKFEKFWNEFYSNMAKFKYVKTEE